MVQKQIVDPVDAFRKAGVKNPGEVINILRQNFHLHGTPVSKQSPESVLLANRLTGHIQKLFNNGNIKTYDVKRMDAADMDEVLSIVKKPVRITPMVSKPAVRVRSDIEYRYKGQVPNPKARFAHNYEITTSKKIDDNLQRVLSKSIDPTSILSITSSGKEFVKTSPMSKEFISAVKEFQERVSLAGYASLDLKSIIRNPEAVKKIIPKMR